MQTDGGGHVLSMDLSVAPFGLEEAKEPPPPSYLHVPVRCNPFGTGDAWPTAAELWQDPAEESCAPVLP